MELWRYFSTIAENGRYESVKDGFKFLFALLCLCCLLIGGGRALRQKCRLEWAKLTAFECGFDPLRTTYYPFSIRFFLLALLFLIFDLEVVLLIPYILRLKIGMFPMPLVNKRLCGLFLLILLGGLLHEYHEGRLDWVVD